MLIVLEGLDGAGKSTQIELLRQYIESKGIRTEYLHFPRFDAPIFGDLIARFLRGEFGTIEQVDPYLVALLYAGDRADAAKTIREWIDDGAAVILDRYVYSNIGYQCAKLRTEEERKKLSEWILDLEYNYYKIPQPDLSLFLDVPFAFTERKLSEQREGDDRNYLKGQQDIHEGSLSLQQSVREVYLNATKSDKQLKVVSCDDGNGMMATPDEIFSRIKLCADELINRTK
ncbi:MAG: dTMP kinase [Alistipes sp.]|nr:dTMP kinase [Alistipes sp.]